METETKSGLAELRIGDIRVLGQSECVSGDDETTVGMCVDGEKQIDAGAPGVYGLVWIPLE